MTGPRITWIIWSLLWAGTWMVWTFIDTLTGVGAIFDVFTGPAMLASVAAVLLPVGKQPRR